MTVGESLRTLRLAAGLLQRELAQEIGVSDSMLSLIESGKREPSIRLLRQVSEVLDVPSGILFAVALADDAPSRAGSREATAFTEELFLAATQALAGRHRSRKKEK